MAESTESFEALAEANLRPLYNLAVRLVRRPEEAEDLVQETLLRAFRFYDSFEPGTNFKAWLFKILKNSFINRYRKKQQEPDMVHFGAIEEGLERIVDSTLRGSQSPPPDPERLFMDGLVDDELEAAIRELPPEYRMVLIMAVVEEMSYKEIAAALSCPIGTVMSRLHRARRLMQSRLVEYARRRGLAGSDGSDPGVVDITRFRGRKP